MYKREQRALSKELKMWELRIAKERVLWKPLAT